MSAREYDAYVDYQRALLRLAFAAEDAAELAGFERYRTLVRERLLSLARAAFPRSWALLGERPCAASFFRSLAADPPRDVRLWAAVAGFARYAREDTRLCALAPYARDLLAFEAAKWRVANAPSASEQARPLDFDGPLLCNPALELLSLEHTVDALPEPLPSAAHTLFVYRPPACDEVRWYRADPLLAELLGRCLRERQPLRRALPDAAAACGQPLDQPLLVSLARELARASERGVVLGVGD